MHVVAAPCRGLGPLKARPTLAFASRRNGASTRLAWQTEFAIAGVGLKTSLLEMKKVGGRAIALLVAEALFLILLMLAMQRAVA
jgi:hypothetical protein